MKIVDKDTKDVYYESQSRSDESYKVKASFWKTVRAGMAFVRSGGSLGEVHYTELFPLSPGEAKFEELFSEVAQTAVGRAAMDGEITKIPMVL